MIKADDLTFLADLETVILKWGATLVGFGDVSCGLVREFRHIPQAISIAIKHPPASASEIRKGGIIAYNNQFTYIDEKLKDLQKNIVTYLRMLGWRGLAIPPDSDQQDNRFISRLFPLFQHKTAATCSGLGWIGKNGLLVNNTFGARLSWATVLTNAPLPITKAPIVKGRCGSCTRCVDICPAGAIRNQEWVRGVEAKAKIDVAACAKQLKKNFDVMGKSICGLCIASCPLGRKG